jgi:5-methylcytosine-specific restriction endonuclease McrA
MNKLIPVRVTTSPTNAHDKSRLLVTAREVAEALRMHSNGTRLRARPPHRASVADSDGWYAVIGNLGKRQARLEVWLDRFSRYRERKFYAGFYSGESRRVTEITKRVSRKLWPIRVFTLADTEQKKCLVLKKRLRPTEFNAPILEKYPHWTYFGIYDPASPSTFVSRHFCARAVAFFVEVARSLPQANSVDQQRDVYPRYENRKRVASHLDRERSGLLATQRKIRDNYTCQVCGMRFDKIYGDLGRDFAEAHHVIPLGHLQGRVKTSLNDLRTVCANCHRMLHRMTGKRDDIARLRACVRDNRRKLKSPG